MSLLLPFNGTMKSILNAARPTLTTLPAELIDHILSFLTEQEYFRVLARKPVEDFYGNPRFNLARTSRRLRAVVWPTWLATTKFIITSTSAESRYSQQIESLHMLTPEPSKQIKHMHFQWPCCCKVSIAMKGEALEFCKVWIDFFRLESRHQQRVNDHASDCLSLALTNYALREGAMDWTVALQLSCRLQTLVVHFHPVKIALSAIEDSLGEELDLLGQGSLVDHPQTCQGDCAYERSSCSIPISFDWV